MPALVPFVVTATGTGVAQDLTVPGDHPHTFASDTYPSFGGADAAPSPLSYVLGALTSCNQVTGATVAQGLGVRLGAWDFHVQGDLNPAVLATGADGNANFDRVTVEVSVETDADDASWTKLVAETERRCPVTQLFKRSGLAFDSTWTRKALV